MKKILITILFCSFLAGVFAQSNNKTDQIKYLLEISGSGKIGVQVAQTMIQSFKQTFPTVPEQFWIDFSKELNADSLINLIIPIYDKYYSLAEINQIIAFYETPIGKKTIALMPQIMQESMQAGQAWGEEIGKKVQGKLSEKGYIKAD